VLPLVARAAHAITLTPVGTSTVADGVQVTEYRSASPATDLFVAEIDLCATGVYVDATRAPGTTQSTGSWAASQQDVVLATNGDFYKTGPVRVYGDAVGGGVRWPLVQTGLDPSYAGEWYWEHHGWIAFLHDGVAYTHTGWVKSNAATFGALGGWEPADLQPDPPPGTLALVSGFPELVVEGRALTCADPEASDCFPDRSDLRDRHPRTAMGLTADLSTLILVVADGRTSRNSGLYGSELASVMNQLGAWVAFNVDGGGSSQLWADGAYRNDPDGNNSGGGTRAVANHWGVFAGAVDHLPDRPGHCGTAAPCESLPPEGGTLDDSGACFRGFGNQDYWRAAAGGVNGELQWTNAFRADAPDNWAWWRLELEEGGTYRVEVSSDATWSVHDDVRYEVRADGVSREVRVDPRGGGWHSLGEHTFAAGGDQWVAVFDHEATDPGADAHVVADAVRLTRLDPLGEHTGLVDTGDPPPTTTPGPDPADSSAPGGSGPTARGGSAPPDGCGCRSSQGSAWTGLGALAALVARRRRRR
jgi:MYXO-CTERM domain-containing protein